MLLPYLKYKRWPRVAQGAPDEKLVKANSSQHLDDACMGEIFEAVEKRDTSKLRSALEALVRNQFEWEGDAA